MTRNMDNNWKPIIRILFVATLNNIQYTQLPKKHIIMLSQWPSIRLITQFFVFLQVVFTHVDRLLVTHFLVLTHDTCYPPSMLSVTKWPGAGVSGVWCCHTTVYCHTDPQLLPLDWPAHLVKHSVQTPYCNTCSFVIWQHNHVIAYIYYHFY